MSLPAVAFGAGFYVRVQMPLALGDDSEPEPDVAVVPGSPRDYLDGHPETALLVVEVADTSLAYDREQKLPLYARWGIPEALLVDLNRSAVEVHRDPGRKGYRSRAVRRHGDGALGRLRPAGGGRGALSPPRPDHRSGGQPQNGPAS